MFAAWAAFAALWPKLSANHTVAAATTELGLSIGAGKRTHIQLDKDYDRWDVMYRLADQVHDHLDTLRISTATDGSDASPISCRETIELYSKYKGGIDAAYADVCKQTSVPLKAGIPASTSIAHEHGVAVQSGIDPFDHSMRHPADRPPMDAVCGLIFGMIAGWNRSFGVVHKIEMFQAAAKPTIYTELAVVPAEFAA
ncbi:DUF1937 family protein [Rhodopila sp.]|uniref:DUF1937 family protein n=1 Tax=Rhodopila sp. TaxID=2480087 RepID=UPI003D0BF610